MEGQLRNNLVNISMSTIRDSLLCNRGKQTSDVFHCVNLDEETLDLVRELQIKQLFTKWISVAIIGDIQSFVCENNFSYFRQAVWEMRFKWEKASGGPVRPSYWVLVHGILVRWRKLSLGSDDCVQFLPAAQTFDWR